MFTKKLTYNVLVLLFSSATLLSTVQAQESWWDKIKKELKVEDQVSALPVNNEQIEKALKQALSVGSETVVKTLQRQGAFADNPNLRIKLPSSLAKVDKALSKVGLGQWTGELEAKLNEAAEQAVPAAGPILLDAIDNLTLEDVMSIYQGENDAATQYFKTQMSQPILTAIEPIIRSKLENVGALKLYDQIIAKYQSIPFMPDASSDLVALVQNEALASIFNYLAKEEAAIRENPQKRTTDLLKQVFDSK